MKIDVADLLYGLLSLAAVIALAVFVIYDVNQYRWLAFACLCVWVLQLIGTFLRLSA